MKSLEDILLELAQEINELRKRVVELELKQANWIGYIKVENE